MAILKLENKYLRPVVFTATGLFLFLAIIFFIPGIRIEGKIALPMLCLFVAGLWLCPWQMCAAFAFSAAGDYLSSCGCMIGQIGAFAAAHLMMVWYFLVRYFAKVEHDRKLTGKAKGFLAMVAFCALVLLAVSFFKIAPGAPAGVIRIGVCIYSVIICAMMVSAMLQRSSLFALGAILFVFSDFILAWNLFAETIPNADLMVMIPYYLGQWLLFIRSTPFRVGPEMRLMRF